MKAKEAKIKAYQIAVALLNGGVETEHDKVNKALCKIADELQRRVEKIDRPINKFTGTPNQ